MPALRGLFASLGASVSLAAAGTLALLAVSLIILFQGFPGLGGIAEGGPLDLATPRSEPTEPDDDGPVVLADAPDEDASAPPAEPLADDGPPSVADDPAPVGDRPAGAADDDLAPDIDDLNPPDDPDEDPIPRREPDGDRLIVLGGEPVSGLTGLTGDVLRTTGETLAPVTDSLLPGLGKTVEALTDVLGDTVESTGGTLGATL
ncbi:MAG TPA: hypothetical protein VGW11_12670 [Solirubrobacteraceae bacterium]|nr:hypothetical protein [Solirubrobacteraceae bacterium]